MPNHDNQSSGAAPSCRSPVTSSATPQSVALDRNFRNAVAGLRRELVRTICYLRVIYDRKVYRALGYRNIRSYGAAAGGLNEKQCKAFLKIGARLGDLPAMRQALESGSLSWRKAEAIVERADATNEADLIDTACLMSTEELARHMKAATTRENTPHLLSKADSVRRASGQTSLPVMPEVPNRGSRRSTVRAADDSCFVTYKFTPEQYSRWTALSGTGGSNSKEEELLDALAKCSLSAAVRSEPQYLIVLQQCPDCGLAIISNTRGDFAAPLALLEAARCDGVIEDVDARRKRIIPPRLRRTVLRRDRYRCQARECRNTCFLELHHRTPIAQGGRTVAENLITLCQGCHRRLHREEEVLYDVNRSLVD